MDRLARALDKYQSFEPYSDHLKLFAGGGGGGNPKGMVGGGIRVGADIPLPGGFTLTPALDASGYAGSYKTPGGHENTSRLMDKEYSIMLRKVFNF